jgi:NitT/TauT family transport system ATP-binding protein
MTAVTSTASTVVEPVPLGVPALRLDAVSKAFGGREPVWALRDVDLSVAPGEFVTVVGPSGCGKSTLLNVVAGLDSPTKGSVHIDGRPALMFQDATLLPWLTARQNVELALRARGVPKRDRSALAEELLGVVRLGNTGHKRPHELSGGMRQRVALARCLAQDAQLVLMDEPLGALDAMTRDQMHDEIERVSEERDLTVLFVTHNMREAVRLADRVVLMAHGRVVHEHRVPLFRPRVMDSADVANRAAELTARLKEYGSGTTPERLAAATGAGSGEQVS